MKISVIITTKNRLSHLERCVDSIRRSTMQCDELIIVDDGSSDGTEKLEGASFGIPNCTIIHNPVSLELVRSRNIGARMAMGELVLFIDDDNEVAPDMIEKLVASSDAHPVYGILGPSWYRLDTREKYWDYQCFSFYTGKTSGGIHPGSEPICDSDGVSNVFLVRRQLLIDHGFFDESLVVDYTEMDHTFALKQHGYRSGVVKAAVTYHDLAAADRLTVRSLCRYDPMRSYYKIRNRAVMVLRYGRFRHQVVYMALVSWFWPLAYSLLALREGNWEVARVTWRGYRDEWRYFLFQKL